MIINTKLLIAYIVLTIAGLIVGYFSLKLAKKQIKVRCESIPELAEQYNPNLLNSKPSYPLFMIGTALIYDLACFRAIDDITHLVFILICVPCFLCISAVDLAIRRIPNELLLVLIITGIIYNIAHPLIADDVSFKQNIILALIGFVGSIVIFIIPQKFGMYIGSGDIKLSIVIGFSLGIFNYLQAMVVMAILNIILLAYLLIAKKGGTKTKSPMGPSLAFGALSAMLFPIVASNASVILGL